MVQVKSTRSVPRKGYKAAGKNCAPFGYTSCSFASTEASPLRPWDECERHTAAIQNPQRDTEQGWGERRLGDPVERSRCRKSLEGEDRSDWLRAWLSY